MVSGARASANARAVLLSSQQCVPSTRAAGALPLVPCWRRRRALPHGAGRPHALSRPGPAAGQASPLPGGMRRPDLGEPGARPVPDPRHRPRARPLRFTQALCEQVTTALGNLNTGSYGPAFLYNFDPNEATCPTFFGYCEWRNATARVACGCRPAACFGAMPGRAGACVRAACRAGQGLPLRMGRGMRAAWRLHRHRSACRTSAAPNTPSPCGSRNPCLAWRHPQGTMVPRAPVTSHVSTAHAGVQARMRACVPAAPRITATSMP